MAMDPAKCINLVFTNSTWSQCVESLGESLTQVLKFDGHLKLAHPWKVPQLIHRIVEVYWGGNLQVDC